MVAPVWTLLALVMIDSTISCEASSICVGVGNYPSIEQLASILVAHWRSAVYMTSPHVGVVDVNYLAVRRSVGFPILSRGSQI